MCLYYQNVRGLKTKVNKILLTSISCDYNIVCFTETWLNPEINNAEIFANKFLVYRQDRNVLNSTKSDGGGVLIAVLSVIDSELFLIPNTETIECICVKLKLSNKHIYIYCLYIPPNSSEDVLTKHLKALEFLSDQLRDSEFIIIVGDFNLPTINWIEDDSNINVLVPTNLVKQIEIDIIDIVLNAGLYQINKQSNHQGRTLDLFFTNIKDDILVELANIPMSKVDKFHPPCEIFFKISDFKELKTNLQKPIFDFNKTNFVALNDYFF